MGFNTTVIVYNDALGAIENDPEFGAKISRAASSAMYGGPVDIPSGNHCNAAVVVDCHHADEVRVYAIGANHAKRLGEGTYLGYRDDEEKILQELARNLGYALRKRPDRNER